MLKILLVGLGGGAGALARWGLAGLVHRLFGGGFPLGTFVVNLTGCLLFGLAWGLVESRGLLGPSARMAVLTGFLGAFTTFSTFAFESAQLLRLGQWGLALANVAGQVVLGLVFLFLGLALSRLF
jgi:CrcB protein